jgi:hypothetical protein
MPGTFFSRAATPSQFASANSAIANAFAATASAKENGGNVSGLVASTNLALNFTEQAQAVNSSNPSEATVFLQNATRIAQQVASEAASVQSSGAAAKQITTDESIGGAIATVVIAVLIYIYGGRIYRTFWFFIYRNHVVKRPPVRA